jgi:hypothetical protein
MKTSRINLLLPIALTVLASCSIPKSETAADINLLEFYELELDSYVGQLYFRSHTDSLKDHPKYASIGENMYNHLDYFVSQCTPYLDQTYAIDSFNLADTTDLKERMQYQLANDTLLKELVFNCVNSTKLESTTIDELAGIVARFFYLHKPPYANRPIVHHCISTNGVNELPQRNISPYLNAFAWDIVRSGDSITGVDVIFDFIGEDFIYKQLADETPVHVVDSISKVNFLMIAKNQETRNFIIKNYEQKKKFLNFELIY